MQKEHKNKLIDEYLNDAKSVAILPSKVGGLDAFCAAVGLFHILKKQNKKVNIIYPGQLPIGAEDLIEPEAIINDVKAKDLLIAVDYSGTNVEKVQYLTDEFGVFYLRLGPITGDFDTNRVKTEILGHRNDMYIIIGANVLEDLGQTYHEMRMDILKGKVVNFDITTKNTRYGHVNFVDPSKDSISLLALNTALEWEYGVDSDAAKAFLVGISSKK